MRQVLSVVKPDIVIHTASPVASAVVVGAAAKKRQNDMFYKVNVEGTRTLLEETRRAGCEVFVFTSSASVTSDTVNDLVNADERYDLITGKAQKEYYSDTKVRGIP